LAGDGVEFNSPAGAELWGEGLEDGGVVGEVIRHQPRAINHNPRDHAINIIQIRLQQRPHTILDIGHILLIDKILPEEQVILCLELLMFFPRNEPWETQLENDFVLVGADHVVHDGEFGGLGEEFGAGADELLELAVELGERVGGGCLGGFEVGLGLEN